MAGVDNVTFDYCAECEGVIHILILALGYGLISRDGKRLTKLGKQAWNVCKDWPCMN
jgi:hypothetical protein